MEHVFQYWLAIYHLETCLSAAGSATAWQQGAGGAGDIISHISQCPAAEMGCLKSLPSLTCLSSACVLPDVWVNSIKTRISLLFSCRLTFLFVFKVVWGNGLETSHPQPTCVPHCLSHLHGGSAFGVTTAPFVVSWSQGGEKKNYEENKLSSAPERRESLGSDCPFFQCAVGSHVLNALAPLGTKAN